MGSSVQVALPWLVMTLNGDFLKGLFAMPSGVQISLYEKNYGFHLCDMDSYYKGLVPSLD